MAVIYVGAGVVGWKSQKKTCINEKERVVNSCHVAADTVGMACGICSVGRFFVYGRPARCGYRYGCFEQGPFLMGSGGGL